MGKAENIVILLIFNLIIITFIIAIFIYIREYRSKKRAFEKDLDKKDNELLKAQNEIQRETMATIGREIHDNVGQKLTLSSIYLQQIDLGKDINKRLAEVNILINDSLSDLRQLSKTLVDDSIHQHSLVYLIDQECDKVKQLTDVHTHFTNSNFSKTELGYIEKSFLLRIVQEFIQNSIKHSGCSLIEIELQQTPTEIRLNVFDNGRGFEADSIHKGSGLKNIAKRIEILNGWMDIQSNPSGTSLSCKISL